MTSWTGFWADNGQFIRYMNGNVAMHNNLSDRPKFKNIKMKTSCSVYGSCFSLKAAWQIITPIMRTILL